MDAGPGPTWPPHSAVPDDPPGPGPSGGPPGDGRGGDCLLALLDAVRLIPNVTAGTVLLSQGRCRAIPGLPRHALLHHGSPVVAAAHQRVDADTLSSSFLWPADDRGAPRTHVRVTVLNAPTTGTPRTTGLLLLSPAGELHDLTPRELEVLGFLVEGACNQEIATALVIAPRTVATHLEHILDKLNTPTRTLAAVRAEQHGLFVPPQASPRRRTLPARRQPPSGC